MGKQTPTERLAITRQKELRERYSSDELIAELDRRLEEQGIDTELGGIKVVVDYLREGFSIVALPPEVAERVVGGPVTPTTLHRLAGELRQAITHAEASGG